MDGCAAPVRGGLQPGGWAGGGAVDECVSAALRCAEDRLHRSDRERDLAALDDAPEGVEAIDVLPVRDVLESCEGKIAAAQVSAGTYETKRFGEVSLLDAQGSWDEQGGTGAMFLVHRGMTESLPVEI